MIMNREKRVKKGLKKGTLKKEVPEGWSHSKEPVSSKEWKSRHKSLTTNQVTLGSNPLNFHELAEMYHPSNPPGVSTSFPTLNEHLSSSPSATPSEISQHKNGSLIVAANHKSLEEENQFLLQQVEELQLFYQQENQNNETLRFYISDLEKQVRSLRQYIQLLSFRPETGPTSLLGQARAARVSSSSVNSANQQPQYQSQQAAGAANTSLAVPSPHEQGPKLDSIESQDQQSEDESSSAQLVVPIPNSRLHPLPLSSTPNEQQPPTTPTLPSHASTTTTADSSFYNASTASDISTSSKSQIRTSRGMSRPNKPVPPRPDTAKSYDTLTEVDGGVIKEETGRRATVNKDAQRWSASPHDLMNFERRKSIAMGERVTKRTAVGDFLEAEGWTIERAREGRMQPLLTTIEAQSWYQDYFYGTEHRNFIGIDTPLGTYVLSFRRESSTSSDKDAGFIRILLQTQDGCQRALIPARKMPSFLGWHIPAIKLLATINPLLVATGITREVYSSPTDGLCKDLLEMELKERPNKYKFGVLLAKEGQLLEEEMWRNTDEDGSPEWHEFLSILGEQVQLQGWTAYSGGLDVKQNSTGLYSRYARWKDNEVMWHVSTLLPFTEGDQQQIERKRHLGNNCNIIVFLDGPAVTFSPTTITSQFIHNIITVRCVNPTPLEAASLQTNLQLELQLKKASETKTSFKSRPSPRTRPVTLSSTSPRGASDGTGEGGPPAPPPPPLPLNVASLPSRDLKYVSFQRAESGASNGPSLSSSQQQQHTHYRISVCSKEGVCSFGPLPKPPLFHKVNDRELFRDYLFSKVISAELATHRSLHFAKKLRKGRRAMLDALASRYFPMQDQK
ncbi:Rap1 GTPase-activating protein 1 [Balamuthia mandrillaris]